MIVVANSWLSPDPLAWIHRVEAHSIAAELRRTGHRVQLLSFAEALQGEPSSDQLLLRLSDPVMLDATTALARAGVPYAGPGAEPLERCYDKYAAYNLVDQQGLRCPLTKLAHDADDIPLPRIIKPRRGSDSIGVRLQRARRDGKKRSDASTIVQQRIIGTEVTVAVLGSHTGLPLEILLPEGALYTFARKYLRRTRKRPLADATITASVRAAAREIAELLAIDWAARVDFILERDTGHAYFLECDAAPLIGATSAFAMSLTAAGIARDTQWQQLLA